MIRIGAPYTVVPPYAFAVSRHGWRWHLRDGAGQSLCGQQPRTWREPAVQSVASVSEHYHCLTCLAVYERRTPDADTPSAT